MKFGARIREARVNKNLSQEDLANQLYISKQSISKYENNKAKPSKEILDEMASILELNLKDVQLDNQKIDLDVNKKIKLILSLCVIFMLITIALFIHNRLLVNKINKYEQILNVQSLNYHGLEMTYLDHEFRMVKGREELWVKISVYNSNDDIAILDSNLFSIDEMGIETSHYYTYINKSWGEKLDSRVEVHSKESQMYFVRISVDGQLLSNSTYFYLKYSGKLLISDKIESGWSVD